MNKDTGIEVKSYKLKALPSKPIPNAVIYIKADNSSEVSTYITDINGIPYSLIELTNLGIQTIYNTDGTISIMGTDNVQINLSNSIKNVINSALQQGDNISELINDVGYITLADIPSFNPSDYDLEEFINTGIDPYVHQSEITNGITNLTYIASSIQGTINSDTGTDAVIPLADSINAGLLSPANKIKLDNTSGVNSGDQTSIAGITGTKTQYNTSLTDGDFLFTGDITQYTDELAQDAVGNILTDTSTIDLSYNDAGNTISADVKPNSITATQLADNINISEFTNNVGYELTSNKGISNGYASLDAGGKIPVSQLPNSVMELQGAWNASTNIPTLIDGIGNPGDVWKVTTAGTQNLGSGNITFEINDFAVYGSSGIWFKSDNTDAVNSVFGRVGTITAQNGDYTSSQITNIPFGNISSITVQSALNELDSEKAIDTNVIHTTGNETKTGSLTVNNIIKSGGTANDVLLANGTTTTINFISSNAIVETILDGDTAHTTSSNGLHDALQKKLNLPTGFIFGLQLSINAGNNTKYDIAPGVYTVTNFSDLANPIVTIISYPGATGLTPAYLATANSTYIALDINQNIISSSSPFTNSNRRDLAIIGNVVHSNHVNINVTNEIKAPIVASINQLHDFMRAVGFLNEEGNIYSANGANQQINKSAGKIFGMGINSADYTNPHQLTIPSQTALTFAYRYRTGTQLADTTNINPNIWDNNGIPDTVPVGNRWTIQRINLFQSGITRIQPGQQIFTSYNDAVTALPNHAFVTEQNIADNAVFRCYLIVKRGVTDLAASVVAGESLFVPVDKFGNVIGNGSVALTYSNIIAALGFTPEDTANKTGIVTGNETSTSLYLHIAGMIAYFQQKLTDSIFGTFITSLTTKTTIVDADSSVVSDSGDGGKAKKVTWLNIFNYIKSKSDTEISYACSDETSDLAVGTLITFRQPFAMTLTSIKLSLNNAPTVSKVIVDIKENGTSIFSTLISVDTGATTSVGASVPYVISDANIADDSVMTIATTQVGSGSAGKGLKVTLIGKRV